MKPVELEKEAHKREKRLLASDGGLELGHKQTGNFTLLQF